MKKRKFDNGGGVYTADMGQPPMEPDDASAAPPAAMMPKKRPMPARPPMPPQGIPAPGSPPPGMPAPSAQPPGMPPQGIGPMKRPMPKNRGMFREGMPVPQDVDGASARPMKKGGSVSSASKRADGCCERGKTKGKYL